MTLHTSSHDSSSYRPPARLRKAAPSAAERPRERLLAHGPGALTNAELLAIVLRTGTAGCPAVQLGQKLLSEFDGLRGLLGADTGALLAVHGLGAAKACEILAISELHQRALAEQLSARPTLDTPMRVKQYCAARLGHLHVEHCLALFLDNQLRLIAAEEVARGTLAQASVYPREIVKAGLRLHAAALILAHNHPSGRAQASDADRALTARLKQALALVDIRLIDHLIVAGANTVSMAEQRLV
ncbi:DNA repair protein RadC [Pusillimonas sp. TS35]|uniref:RadC family protein n=1 Tax=Paracandidimonas lactea TaxID=2895524 RepID=UPI00136C5C5B|nr:DNA repair protein RadC [Paracandidimonas lactea]MYN11561.1 DNA repair protein RadC [Pusillimonas sp. TS35]